MQALTPAVLGRRTLNDWLAREALRSGRGAVAHKPMHVYVQVASGCNLDCYMCSEHLRPPHLRHGRGLVSMERAIFDKLAAQVFPYSSKVTIGVGGEPTLAPHFVYFVERAWELEQEVHLMTNGTRLARAEVAEPIARCVSSMEISLDASTQATYERIRLGSNWKHIRAALQNLNRHRDAQPPGRRTHVTFCFVLMRSNLDELPGFVEFAHEMRADAVRAQHVIGVTAEGEADSLQDQRARYDDVRAIAVERAKQLGVELTLPKPYAELARSEESAHHSGAAPVRDSRDDLLAKHAVPCQMPALDTYVLYDGRVFPCCHPFAHSKMQVGDLRTQDFDEIWNGRLYRSLRAGLKSGDVPSICRNCSLVNDPPPAPETAETLEHFGGLAAWLGERDLAPISADQVDDRAIAKIEAVGLTAWVGDLRQHATALEHEREVQRGRLGALERELASSAELQRRAAELERERGEWQAHARALESERDRERAWMQEPAGLVTRCVRKAVRVLQRRTVRRSRRTSV